MEIKLPPGHLYVMPETQDLCFCYPTTRKRKYGFSR